MKGRFIPGHNIRPKNPGRKPKAVEIAYLEILRRLIPEEDWKEMVDAVAMISKGRGDIAWDKVKPADIIKAFQVLAEYLIGKLPQELRMSSGPVTVKVISGIPRPEDDGNDERADG